jgi:hypothetical protein
VVKLSELVCEWLNQRYTGYKASTSGGFTCLDWNALDGPHICIDTEHVELYDPSFGLRYKLEACNPEFFTVMETYLSGKMSVEGWEKLL